MKPGTVTLLSDRRWFPSGAVLPAGEHAATLISRGSNWVQVRFADGKRATLLSYEGTFRADVPRCTITDADRRAFACVEAPAVSATLDR